MGMFDDCSEEIPGEIMATIGQYRWGYLAGAIPSHEMYFLKHLCKRGHEAATARFNDSKTERNLGSVEAFLMMSDFTNYRDFVSTWQAICAGMQEATIGYNKCDPYIEADEHQRFYWRLGGQMAQVEFVLERMLIFREIQNGYQFVSRQPNKQAFLAVTDYLDNQSSFPA